MLKRVLSLFLALVMTLSMVPTGAFAAETEGITSDMDVEISREEMEDSSLGDLYAGSTVGVSEEFLETEGQTEPSVPETEDLADEPTESEIPGETEETVPTETPVETTVATVPVPDALSEGNWLYRLDEDGNAVVLGYLDTAVRSLTVPYTLEGHHVVALAEGALGDLMDLTTIEIHGNVAFIGAGALPEGTVVSAYHGAEALRCAAENGMEVNDLSEFYFVDGVVDYSDIPADRYAFAGNTTIRMKALEAARLEVGSVFYLPSSAKYVNGEGFVVKGMEDLGDWVELTCRVARGDEIIYRVVIHDQNMQIDWDNIVAYGNATVTPVTNTDPGSRQGKAFNESISHTLNISLEDNIFNDITSVFIESETSITASADIDINLISGRISEFKMTVDESVVGKGGIKLEAPTLDAEGAQAEEERIPLAKVPLTGTGVTVYAEIGLVISVSGSIEVEFETTTTRGVEWNHATGQFEKIDKSSSRVTPVKGEIACSFGLYLEVGLDAPLLGEFLYMDLDVTVNLTIVIITPSSIGVHGDKIEEFEKQVYPLLCLQFEADITAKLSMTMELSFLDDKGEWSYTIFDKELDKVEIGSRHFERYVIGGGWEETDGCTASAYATVNFYCGAGSDVKIPSQEVEKGEYAKLPPAITGIHENYTFLGWFTEDDVKWDFATMPVEKNLNLYAHWDVEGENELVYTEGLEYSYFTDVVSNEKTGINITGIGQAKGVKELVIPREIEGLPVQEINVRAFENEQSIEIVRIPPTVKHIRTSAFKGCSNLQELDLTRAAELYSISTDAFSGTAITEVTIPNHVDHIDGFNDCPELTSVTIEMRPLGIYNVYSSAKIWSNAFGSDKLVYMDLGNVGMIEYNAINSTSLRSISIPANAYIISGGAFIGMPNLEEILAPSGQKTYQSIDGVLYNYFKYTETYDLIAYPAARKAGTYALPYDTIGVAQYAFAGAQLDEIRLNDNLEALHGYAFANSTIKSIRLGGKIKTIPMGSFENCTQLKHITLPDSVESVAIGAFKGSGLESATLSAGMNTVSMAMFSGCANLKRLTIPEGYTAIELLAFDGCYALERLDIPASVTSIDESALRSVLAYQLEHQNDPGAHVLKIYGKKDSYAETWAKAHGVPFYEKQEAPVRYKLTWETNGGSEVPSQMKYEGMKLLEPADPVRPGYTFTGWYRDDKFTILWDFENNTMPAENMTLYARWEFARDDYHYTLNLQEGEYQATFDYYDGPLDTILVPETIDSFTVTAIGPNAFSRSNPRKIILPATVTSIDKTAFFGCNDLTEIQLEAGNAAFVMKNNVLFSADMTQLIRAVPKPVSGAVSSYMIPNTVTEVYPHAFQNCDNLTTVSVSTLSPKLQIIGQKAFALCSNLTKVTLPGTVTQIGETIFYGCHKDLRVYSPLGNQVISGYMHENLHAYNLYRVTYRINAEEYYGMEVEAGTCISGIVPPDEDMMTFGGVYKDSGLNDPWNFETDLMPERNLTLYVKYTSNLQYTGTDEITITGYTGTDNFIVLPETINGKPVKKIAANALQSTSARPLYEITVPSCITGIANGAFTWETDALKPVIICDDETAAASYCVNYRLTMRRISYSITWNAEGARVVSPITMAEPGSLLTAPGFVRDNYTLEGWYKDAAFTEKWDFAKDTMTKGNLTLYAKMQKVNPNVEDPVFGYRSEKGKVTVTSYKGARNFATIPASINGEPVTAIGDFFLRENTDLQILTIPETITHIGRYAFQNSALNKVQFTGDGSKTLTLEEAAFYGCHSLETLQLNRNITQLPANTFQNCSNLRNIYLPDTLQNIEDAAFRDCSRLLSIRIPASVTVIGKQAFGNCMSLKEVVFEGSCPAIQGTAFQNTPRDLVLFYPANAAGWSGFSLSGITAIPIGKGGYIDTLAPDHDRAAIGQAVEWIARAAGQGTFHYRFELYREGEANAIAVQDYSASYTFRYTPDRAGIYRLKVTGKNSGGDLTSSRESVVEVFESAIPIRKIELSQQTLTLRPGASFGLVAAITPSNATQQDLIWTSSNPNVATVDKGMVTAVAMGTASIRVADSSGHVAECMVIVTIPSDPVIDLILQAREVTVRDTLQITAQCQYFAEEHPALLWTSSDEAVATVDANGLVTGVSAGDVTITVSAADGSGAFNRIDLTVLPAKVESISVTAPEYLLANTSAALSAVVLPDYAGDKTVAWSITEGRDLAKIDSSTGVLTAGNTGGTVTVRATANDGSGVYGEVRITIQNCRILIDGKGITELTSGQKLQLTVSCEPEEASTGKITWSSSDPAAASVDDEGLVTAKNVEKAAVVQITARAEKAGIAEAVYSVTIRPKAEKFTLTGETEIDLNQGTTVQLTVVAEPKDASVDVTWKSSSTAIAEVSETGLVTFKKAGKVTITATAADGSKKTAKITLNAAYLVSDIQLTVPADRVYSGKTLQFTAAIQPDNATNRKLIWTVSDPDAASISSSGKLKAKTVQEPTVVEVKVTAADDGKAVATKSVTILSTKMSLRDQNGTLVTGKTIPCTDDETFRLTAEMNRETVPVTWKSSKTSIATIDDGGNVTFHKPGTVTFTATDSQKHTAKVTFKVTVPVKTVTVTSKTGTNVVASGKKINLTAQVAPLGASNKSVQWSIREGVGKISSSGAYTAPKGVTKVQTVIITATAKDGFGSSCDFLLRVYPIADKVTIAGSPDDGKLAVGDTLTLKASVTGKDGVPAQAVTWKVSGNAATIEVTEKGCVVTPVKPGKVTVKATAADGSGKSASVKLTVIQPMQKLAIPAKQVLAFGKKYTFKPVIEPANTTNKKLTYTLAGAVADRKGNYSIPGVAKLTASGALTADKNLKTRTDVVVTVTAQDGSGMSAKCTVSLWPAAAKVTLGGIPEGKTMKVGQTVTLTALVTGKDGNVPAQDVTWKISGSAATLKVTENGCIITANKAGTVTVKVTAADGSGKSASVKLTIRKN